jgi:hypothetical protein
VEYLPDWFPGTSFKKSAREMAARFSLNADLPLAFVKQQMREKKHKMSYLSQALEDSGSDAKMESSTNLSTPGIALDWPLVIVHKHTCVSLYAGGADTTVSSLMTFFMAMALFPEVQNAAQEELDRVVGSERLPSSADKDKLPYIHAVVKEAHRWQ